MESYTGFRSVPKSVTLSDLERPNDRHCTLFHTFGANCAKVAEAKPIAVTDRNVAKIFCNNMVHGGLRALSQDSRLRSAGRGNFQVRGTNLKITTGAFSVAGPPHYNTLPTRLRQTGSRVTFCSKLKTHLLNLSYNV